MFKIFKPSDDTFINNGDAVILPTRATLYKGDNSDFYYEIEASLDYIDVIKSNNILVAPTPAGEQPFRVGNIDTSNHKIKATCKHLFYDSENYLIADSYVVDKNCNDALDHLNDATDNPSPFTTLSDVTTVASYRCVRKSLGEAVNEVLERWGGHLVRDGFNIQIRQNIGVDNGVTIQYKKNLKEITVSESWQNVVTKLLPVGKDGFTLDNLYLYSEIQYDMPFTKTVSFEQDIDRDNYETEEQYINALRDDLTAQGEKYLETSQYPVITYTLSANLEKITDIGDIVKVFDERLGVEFITHVIAYEYNAILGRYESVTFGTAQAKLSDLLTTVNNSISKEVTISAQAQSVQLNSAIAQSETKILGIMGNSYVIYNGDSIMVVDRLPSNTAVNVMRINSQGIAMSNTGISGHFTSCWQIDGTFNAQAVNLINLTADMIKGGILKLGSALNQSGILEVYDEQNNLIAQLDKNGLKMFAQDNSYIVINTIDGFCGYDSENNKTFYVNEDQFVMKKGVILQEITLCEKMRFIPIELYDVNNNLVNDGIGLVSVY